MQRVIDNLLDAAANSLTAWPVSSEPDENGHDVDLVELLKGNYPNPFRRKTRIDFQLTTPGHVSLSVFNLLGQEIEVLIDATLPKGLHNAEWDAGHLPNGVYFYRLTTEKSVESRQMSVFR